MKGRLPCRNISSSVRFQELAAGRPSSVRKVAEKSNGVLRELGPEIQWVESYVTGDKVYCVYIAPSEELIRKHASIGGFPANRISEITAAIDPNTARG